jgi:uncharacterized protein YggT (Ycf19 family)
MDLFIVVAIALTARLIVAFFGVLSAQTWGDVILVVTERITLPLGFDPIKTPYGGFFDLSAAITIAVLLVVEWVLSVARSRG